jgi:hypothetical protein
MNKTVILLMLCLLAACNPTIRVEPGSEPIRIDMNVTINHEIKIKVEKEVEALFDDDELF